MIKNITASNKTLLLVDDESIPAALQKRQLESCGYSVLLAYSGEEALLAMKDESSSIDLILMDVDLGSGMDGPETAREILKSTDIPIVFLSSHIEEDIVRKTEKITSYGYVVKNTGIVVLDASIKMAFRLYDEKQNSNRYQSFLLESQRDLSEAQKLSHVGSWTYDPVLSLWDWSDEMYEIWNRKVEDGPVPFSELRQTFSSKTGKEFDAAFRKALENGEYRSVEVDLEQNSIVQGSIVFIFRPVVGEDGRTVLLKGTCQDISEIKAIEAKLEESDKRYKTIFETVHDAIFIFDPDTFKILEANKATSELYGYSMDELVGMSCLEFSAEVDESKSTAKHTGQKGGVTVPIRHHKRKDGSDLYLKLSAYRVPAKGRDVMFAVCQDITDKTLMEKTVRDQEKMFHALFEQAGGYCLILDPETEDGIPVIIDASNAACRIHGYEKEELINRPITFIEEESSEHVRKRINEILSNDIFFDEISHRRKDGTTFPVTVNAKRITMKDGRSLILTSEYDISDRRKAEGIIQRQIKEKELLLREVHHRIKNNIASISSMLMLKKETIKNDECAEIIQSTVSQIESMRVLYDKLLMTSEYQELSAKEFLEGLIDSIEEIHCSGTDFKISRDIADFFLDSKILYPVGLIANELITNALKYGLNDHQDGTVSVKLSRKDRDVSLTVCDSGSGFADDHYTSDDKGFGLTLVEMLVEQLKGTLSISNNGSTCISVRFLLK